jgi:hypothetical protein
VLIQATLLSAAGRGQRVLQHRPAVARLRLAGHRRPGAQQLCRPHIQVRCWASVHLKLPVALLPAMRKPPGLQAAVCSVAVMNGVRCSSVSPQGKMQIKAMCFKPFAGH